MWQLMIEPATHRVEPRLIESTKQKRVEQDHEPRLIESNRTTADMVVATTADVVVVGHDKTGKE